MANRISVNIVANFIGKTWVAAIGLILVPQYIRFLGIESYGLVGFYGTLLGTMSLLDMGLSTTLNRELAKARVENRPAEEVRSMVVTLERVYWGIGIAIALLVVLLSSFIASHWVKTEQLPFSVVRNSVMLMGAVIAFQWPVSLYNGGLMGLERQLADNIIMVVMSTLRAAGILVIFLWVKPSIELFFIWQAGISLLYVMLMRTGLWHYLPKSVIKPKFSVEQLKKVWRFAAGMTGIGLVTFFLLQVDKIVLSNILFLNQYGYYILSFTVATSLSMIVAPINAAFFPRLAGLVAKKDEDGLRKTYHMACRLVATAVFPVGLMLFFFADNILLGWTQDPVTVSNTADLVQVLVAGSLCNSLMVIPYLLILAKGRTKFVIYQNLIAAIILVPMLFWWTNQYGPIGATFVWLTVNAGYIVLSIPILHNKFLKGELVNWYLKDTLLPLMPSLVLVVSLKLLMVYVFPDVNLSLFALGLITLLVLAGSLLFLPESRKFLRKKLA